MDKKRTYLSKSFLDKLSLPFLSYPVAIAITSSPTLNKSLGLSTLLVSNWDTWISPSHPGHNSTKIPKSWIDTTLQV